MPSKFTARSTIASLAMTLLAVTLLIDAYQSRQYCVRIRNQAQAQIKNKSSTYITDNTASDPRRECPADQPSLIGFDNTGAPLCKSLSNQSCAQGQYITSIDPISFKLSCADAGSEVRCDPSEFLTGFEWQGEKAIRKSCHKRLDPFVAWNFEPSLSARGDSP